MQQHSQPQATRLILVRHGETEWNVGARMQGHVDIALNELGRRQAQQLAQALADEGLQAVYSSDLSRARDTAAAVTERVGLELRIDRGLRERSFGIFEGLTYPEIAERYPDDAQRWRDRDPGFGPAGGETLQGFYDRCVATGEALAARHRGELILLVAHGGVLDCLYRAAARAALGMPRSWQLGNATINRLLHTDAGFTLVGWNDAAHLQTAA